MKTAMNILIGIILLVLAFSFILVYANTHPPKYPLHVPPSVFKADYEDVSFTTEDGILLKGWLIKPAQHAKKAPVIILCHGLGANRSDFTGLASSLAQRGYFVLTFDFRAHGESGGSRTSLGLHEQEDIAAALAFIKTRGDIACERTGIYGFSLGGSSAILAAAKTGAFSAVVADSAFTSLKDQARDAITGFYHLPAFPFLPLTIIGYELCFQARADQVSPVSVISRLSPVPILIIAGEGDMLIPAYNGRKLYAVAQEPKELWIIPGADHGGTLAVAGDEYEKRVGEFFDRSLKQE